MAYRLVERKVFIKRIAAFKQGETTMTEYTIRGGMDGKARLAILAQALAPTTQSLFHRIGIRPGMKCLDLGCGSGEVTLELARMVAPEGTALGIDMDAALVESASREAERQGVSNVTFQAVNVEALEEENAFDLVYARALLTHLPDPGSVVVSMRNAAKPGGIVAVEDIDLGGHFCYPPMEAFRRYVHLNEEVMRRKGADPNIGPKLPEILRIAGLKNVQVSLAQPTSLDPVLKAIAPSTFENTADAISEEGLASQEEIEGILAELIKVVEEPGTLVGYPRFFQAWGVRE